MWADSGSLKVTGHWNHLPKLGVRVIRVWGGEGVGKGEVGRHYFPGEVLKGVGCPLGEGAGPFSILQPLCVPLLITPSRSLAGKGQMSFTDSASAAQSGGMQGAFRAGDELNSNKPFM